MTETIKENKIYFFWQKPFNKWEGTIYLGKFIKQGDKFFLVSLAIDLYEKLGDIRYSVRCIVMENAQRGKEKVESMRFTKTGTKNLEVVLSDEKNLLPVKESADEILCDIKIFFFGKDDKNKL